MTEGLRLYAVNCVAYPRVDKISTGQHTQTRNYSAYLQFELLLTSNEFLFYIFSIS